MARVWYAVDTTTDQSPPLARLRAILGETGDVYFYRAYAFAKAYRQTGQLFESWPDVAAFVRWPGADWSHMRETFVTAGAVLGERHTLFAWEGTNGWILARTEWNRKRMEDKRKAGRISARKRRAAAKARRSEMTTKGGG